MSDSIPCLSDLNCEYLLKVLAASHDIPAHIEITNIDAAFIGTGKMGDNARLGISYSDIVDAPKSVIAKIPSNEESTRGIASSLGAYANEVRFYQQLAPLTEMKTPFIYQAQINDGGDRFLLLMEDLSPAQPGNQLESLSDNRVSKVVEQAALLHARFYDERDLQDKLFVNRTGKEEAAFGQELLEQNWPGFCDRFGAVLDDACKQFGERYVQSHCDWVCHYHGPKTLIHGDLRSENILFTAGDDATTVDWQTIVISSGFADIAYLLGGSMSPQQRRSHEKRLVEHYRQHLAQAGVELSADEAWQLYRAFSPHGLLITILGAMFSEPDPRGDQMFQIMAQRHLQHCVDMHAEEFF